jgi:hypothetical protein
MAHMAASTIENFGGNAIGSRGMKWHPGGAFQFAVQLESVLGDKH